MKRIPKQVFEAVLLSGVLGLNPEQKTRTVDTTNKLIDFVNALPDNDKFTQMFAMAHVFVGLAAKLSFLPDFPEDYTWQQMCHLIINVQVTGLEQALEHKPVSNETQAKIDELLSEITMKVQEEKKSGD